MGGVRAWSWTVVVVVVGRFFTPCVWVWSNPQRWCTANPVNFPPSFSIPADTVYTFPPILPALRGQG